MLIERIREKQRIRKRDQEWKKNNLHNNTVPVNDFDQSLVTVGNHTYGGIRVCNYNSGSRLKIGHFCSISDQAIFILNADHPTNSVSTYPFKVMCLKSERFEAISKGDIIVEDDVWIGYGAMIMSGVTLRQGTVVATGAVVSKSTEPYSVVGGIPAKMIKKRFEEPVIDYLLTLDFGKLTREQVEEHLPELYSEIDGEKMEKIKKIFEWFPKK